MNNRDDNPATVNSDENDSLDLGIESELAKLRAAGAGIQRMRISAQRELQLAKQMKAEAERNLREIQTKARSQAQMLVIQARLATKKEIAEFSRKSGEEMQKALADMRLIKNAAQKELEAQQKFTNVARLRALSLLVPEEGGQVSESVEGAFGVRKV
jgi:regulator of protease activity HflC (stomatin/prohibitin superfamily)